MHRTMEGQSLYKPFVRVGLVILAFISIRIFSDGPMASDPLQALLGFLDSGEPPFGMLSLSMALPSHSKVLSTNPMPSLLPPMLIPQTMIFLILIFPFHLATSLLRLKS
ncbi:hypothetical protein K438DRAFT_1810033 [Mycena galopus ATCC 62051]|nr:hypothetical protein K438DRAFT_1810033 [Mycena galopus ATCC 62051]